MPLGVTPADSVATQLLFATNSVFPSAKNAAFIGGLSEDTTELSVQSQITANISANVFKFNFEKGSAIKLNLTNNTNTANLRVQLFDVTGRVVADSDGTPNQVSAFNRLNSSSGLSASNGTYYARVTYQGGDIPYNQNYNLQLFSGTTYTNAIVTSAQTQAYDPNLFTSASSSVTASSNALSYAKTATLPAQGSAAGAIDVGNLVGGQTSLYAEGTITTGNRYDYFSFNFQQGSSIKLAIKNTTNALDATALRAQLIDGNGKVVADTAGSEDQINAFKQLDSGAGLAAAHGKYTLRISPLSGAAFSVNQTYNFQLFSGDSYGTEYITTAKLPSANAVDSAGSNVGVYAADRAQLYSRSAYNKIGATANSSVNIGWLAENKSALQVQSQLTSADSAEYYGFTLQKGSALKFNFSDNVTGNKQQVRVQLYDTSGTRVLADNAGTPAQKKAYASLTSPDGYATKPGQFVVKVSYADGADKTKSPIYNLYIYSGTQYSALYKTTASAQSYRNAILTGNANVTGTGSKTNIVNMLNDLASGANIDITQALSKYV